MSAPRARHLHRYPYREYLAHEETSNVKHEFLDGEIFAMAGGTPEHAALAAAVTVVLGAAAGRGPCVYSSDLRIRALQTGLATYPDVTVVCGPLELDPESRTTIVNPTLIVEVLSDSTEEYDRGEKLASYQSIPALQECLLVSHRERRLELWRRSNEGWLQQAAGSGQSLDLTAVPCTIRVDDLYGRILPSSQ
jgi:Uma2 family endonuclease